MSITPILALPIIGSPGPYEFIIIAVIALLLFGKRLPEVARSLGKGIVEFKKGVQGIEEDVTRNTYNDYDDSSSSRPDANDDDQGTGASRFQPPDAPPS